MKQIHVHRKSRMGTPSKPMFSRKPLVTGSGSGHSHVLMVTLARMALWELIQHGGEKVDNSKWFRKLLLVRR